MDVIDRRMLMGRVLASMVGGNIPTFMTHLESGSFMLTENSNPYNDYDIQLNTITKPKGFLIYSNDFNMYDAKADKPMLGAFASLYIAPADISNAPLINGWTDISMLIYYYVNWGQGTNSKFPTARRSINENNRGVYLYNESTKAIRLRGFLPNQSDYDFKFNVTYHWIAWD